MLGHSAKSGEVSLDQSGIRVGGWGQAFDVCKDCECGHDNSNDQVDCILGWSISSKLIEISTDVVVILNS